MTSVDVDDIWSLVKAALRALELVTLAVKQNHPHVMKIELENAKQQLRALLEILEDAELNE